jgi:hypothetical protein
MNKKVRSYDLIPSHVRLLHDTASFFKVVHHDELQSKPAVLESYFNDIYHLFLNKLVKITHESVMADDERTKLGELFQELLKVKSLLQKES